MIIRSVIFSLIGSLMIFGIASAHPVLDGSQSLSESSIDGTGKPRCSDGKDRCTLGGGFGGAVEEDNKEERGSGRV